MLRSEKVSKKKKKTEERLAPCLVEWDTHSLMGNRGSLPVLEWTYGEDCGGVLGIPQRHMYAYRSGKNKTHVTSEGLLVIPHQDLIST